MTGSEARTITTRGTGTDLLPLERQPMTLYVTSLVDELLKVIEFEVIMNSNRVRNRNMHINLTYADDVKLLRTDGLPFNPSLMYTIHCRVMHRTVKEMIDAGLDKLPSSVYLDPEYEKTLMRIPGHGYTRLTVDEMAIQRNKIPDLYCYVDDGTMVNSQPAPCTPLLNTLTSIPTTSTTQTPTYTPTFISTPTPTQPQQQRNECAISDIERMVVKMQKKFTTTLKLAPDKDVCDVSAECADLKSQMHVLCHHLQSRETETWIVRESADSWVEHNKQRVRNLAMRLRLQFAMMEGIGPRLAKDSLMKYDDDIKIGLLERFNTMTLGNMIGDNDNDYGDDNDDGDDSDGDDGTDDGDDNDDDNDDDVVVNDGVY